MATTAVGSGWPPALACSSPRSLLALAGVLAPAARRRSPLAGDDGLTLTTARRPTRSSRHARRPRHPRPHRPNNKPNVDRRRDRHQVLLRGRPARDPARGDATSGRRRAATRLTATTKPADGYRVLEVRFRVGLFYHQTTTVRITFDLPGGAPRSKSDIRVGTAFATFVAWAFGDSGPRPDRRPGRLRRRDDRRRRHRSRRAAARRSSGARGITDVASLVRSSSTPTARPALTSDRIDLAGGEHLVDPGLARGRRRGGRRSRDLLTDGPAGARRRDRARLAGRRPTSSVFEVHTPLLEGYAGVFFQGQDRIEISEDLDDLTIIHEASHAWFNGDLFDGRWINEGFADTYAARALDALGTSGWAPETGRARPTRPRSRSTTGSHPGPDHRRGDGRPRAVRLRRRRGP